MVELLVSSERAQRHPGSVLLQLHELGANVLEVIGMHDDICIAHSEDLLAELFADGHPLEAAGKSVDCDPDGCKCICRLICMWRLII